jgi:hypothetical protein
MVYGKFVDGRGYERAVYQDFPGLDPCASYCFWVASIELQSSGSGNRWVGEQNWQYLSYWGICEVGWVAEL